MILVAAAVGAFAAALVVSPAKAGGGLSEAVVASGLDNPRGLGFSSDGTLYVAESGTGGAGPCFPSPEGGEACFGNSGAVTKVSKGKQRRVVSGLPSFAAPDGSGALGPSDVAVDHGDLYVTVGLGADPARRADLPASGRKAGWLVRGSEARKVADIAGYEASANPDGVLPPDSNPNSVLASHGGLVVADAGGNSLLRVKDNGKVSTLAVFPPLTVPGVPFPVQAVPTSVVRGPDGAYYVGLLTGFPFAVDAARVYRVVPGKAPTVYASGFTNISDIAFSERGTLYVLEINSSGLQTPDATGSLIRVGRNGSQHVVKSSPLIMPGGLALRGDYAYVSNCGVCADGGSVLRIPLR